MERESKFRAIDEATGKFVYGFLLGKKVIGSIDYDGDGCYTITSTIIKTDTVGQFTGLVDKNDKHIYSGDIILNGLGGTWRVTGLDGGSFDLFGICNKYKGKQFLISALNNSAEVIGNIHENPELLKS